MRLLNTTNLRFEDFYLLEIPPYAILSHTWSDGEVDYQQMSKKNARPSQKGFTKIVKTCKLARERGLDWAWIDTCCIDKSSSAELTEAINSMYSWYSGAAVCFVYLEDLCPSRPVEVGLPKCRWFTRGWTLQELLAPKDPKKVLFYDMNWNMCGSKLGFIDIIASCTRIEEEVLLGIVPLADCSVAERMSWAARRNTTRTEDMAYCLLGIFDVNMPLLYGEGMKAFRRLQEEIVKRCNDLSILAWEDRKRGVDLSYRLFADTPEAFIRSSLIRPFTDVFINFSVTNKGLFLSGESFLHLACVDTKNGTEKLYVLLLGRVASEREGSEGGIYLRKLGPKIFIRDMTLPLAGFGGDRVDTSQDFREENQDFYIITDPTRNISQLSFRYGALYVPLHSSFELDDIVPEALWDVTNFVFLKPKPFKWARYPMVIAMAFRGNVFGERIRLVVLCEYTEKQVSPSCKVFRKGEYPREEAIIFRGRNRSESIYWSELKIDAPHILDLDGVLQTRVGDHVIRIWARFEPEIVSSITTEEKMFSLRFDVTRRLYTGSLERERVPHVLKEEGSSPLRFAFRNKPENDRYGNFQMRDKRGDRR